MLGIFGGTFDPVHNGHLRIALDAAEALQLDAVHLIPLGQAVHREQPLLSAAERLELLQLAIADHPRLRADDREIRRDGPSFMVDTLSSLHAEYPDQALALLIGGDAFNGFLSWRDPQGILAMANLVVMRRPGYQLPDDPALHELVAKHACEPQQLGQHGDIAFLDVTQLAISSSDIRARIRAGQDPAFLMPQAVCEKVRTTGWYR